MTCLSDTQRDVMSLNKTLLYAVLILKNRLVLGEDAAREQVSGEVCIVCVHLVVCVCVGITGFSWLLNAIPIADTPRVKL